MKPKTDYTMVCGEYPLDEVVSALQKDIRRGKEKEAFYWAKIMIASGYDNYLWRRLMVIAAEDIGFHDKSVLPFVVACFQGNTIAMEKSKDSKTDSNFIANAVLAMCRATKTREACDFDNMVSDMIAKGTMKLEVPEYAVDMHTKRGREQGKYIGDRGDAFFETEGRKLFPEAPVEGAYKEAREYCARMSGIKPDAQS
ncbi:MAG: hypothetical protein PHU25_01790 [Deltaproteobacteria bacterium]|nr:hypothetical protein [Deltaproteobacteria bacterium]